MKQVDCVIFRPGLVRDLQPSRNSRWWQLKYLFHVHPRKFRIFFSHLEGLIFFSHGLVQPPTRRRLHFLGACIFLVGLNNRGIEEF